MQWRIINDRREILRHTCDKRASKRLALEACQRNTSRPLGDEAEPLIGPRACGRGNSRLDDD
jgi:hypothetical protein